MTPGETNERFDPGYARPGEGEGIGGRLRARLEDFLVEELPLYEPSGEGEHLYLFVEKRNLSTMEMLGVLARHFDVKQRAIGYAGLKDKRAITRQLVSVHLPGRDTSNIPSLRDDRVAILWADRHGNKLRPGHLRGNRFSIRIRDVGFEGAVAARRTLDRLASEGMANRFDEQRFGVLGNNHEIGRALVLGRWSEAVELMLGPSPRVPEAQPEGRRLVAEGKHDAALEHFPNSLRAEITVLRALASGSMAEDAVKRIDRRAAAFYVSAFQSAVFNAVLNARLEAGTADRLLAGDHAFVHGNGKTFEITASELADADVAERLARNEICPSGPMWGGSMRRASGEPGDLEAAALERTGVDVEMLEAFAKESGLMEGGRRPLRVPVISPDVESGVDAHGGYVRCAFELPRGSFATSVMREIMGPDDTSSGAGGRADGGR